MLNFLLLLAKSSSAPTVETKGMSFSWAIVLFFSILGLLVTLSPPKRTTEIKKSKDE